MKKIIAILMTILCLKVSAQNQEDIFRYSNQSVTGSARTLGLSGAWGAAGADLSAATFNPAGLGLYRRNEMMGSIAVTATNSKTDYNGNLMSDGRTGFNIPNLGVAYTIMGQNIGIPQQKGILSGTFAFGMNRLNDFQTSTQYSGDVKNSTIGNYFATQANGTDSSTMWDVGYNNVLFAQAWRLSLIDNNGSPNKYASHQSLLGDSNYTMNQFQQIQTKGRMNEWYAGGGLNVSNFLYLGASFVIDHAEFKSENTYTETMVSSSISGNKYNSSTVSQSLNSSGTGVGGKFGLIIRPVNFLRIGVSYHTPVRLNMKDYFQNSMIMNYNGKSYNEKGVEEYVDYQIVTPQKIAASGSFILGKILMIAADYERVDYTSGRLQSVNSGINYSDANKMNKQVYGVGQNYKAGIEICAGYTRLRAGYAILGSPYEEHYVSKANGMKQLISAGFGWIYDNAYFFDLAISDRIGKDNITPYDGVPTSAVNTTHKLNFVFGAGYRF